MNYATFFSGAGIGCYGFKSNGYDCVLTNEYLEERLAIQKLNNKCKSDSQYIVGDIRDAVVRYSIEKILKEVSEKRGLDVLIATPPCQGISLANHKKTPTEIVRNSLILESILLTKKFKPKYFIYENVSGFLTSACSDSDGFDKEVSEVISNHLSKNYYYESFIFNLKNFSIPSSRTRTVVIGVRKDLNIHPLSIYPVPEKIITLKEAIGHLKSLSKPKETDPSDIFHFFRPYDEKMLPWIEKIKEGQSAFDQKDENRIPNKIIDGFKIINQSKNADKYKRQKWNEVGPCIHTRSDTFSSQNTVHPVDNRVFSIRELMILMSIPNEFNWTKEDKLISNYEEIKKYELNIRKAIGEAFPTRFLDLISKNILKKNKLDFEDANGIQEFITKYIGYKNYEVTTSNSNSLSTQAFEIIKNCIFYNRLNKTSLERCKVYVGNDFGEQECDLIFSTRKLLDQVLLFKLNKIYIYKKNDAKNPSLF